MTRPVATRVLENLSKYDPIVKRLRQKHPEFSRTIDLVKLAVDGLAKYYGLFILDQHGKLINAARIEDDYSRNVTLIGWDLRTWAKNPDLTLKGKMGLEQLYLVLKRCLRDALELYTESERELRLDGVKIHMSASDGFGEYERAKASLWKFQNDFHLHQIDPKRGNHRAIIYGQPGYSGPPVGFGNFEFSTPGWQEPADDCIQNLTADEQTQLKALISQPEVQKLLPDNLRNPNIALAPSEDDSDNRNTPVPTKKIAPLGRPKPQYLQRKGILKNPIVDLPRDSPKKTVRFGPYREPPLPPGRVHEDSPPVTYLDTTQWRLPPHTTVCFFPSKIIPPTSHPRQLSPPSSDNPRQPVDFHQSSAEANAKRASREKLFGPVPIVDNINNPDTPSPTTSSSSSTPSSTKPPVVIVTPNTPSSTASSSSSSSKRSSKLPDVVETTNTPSPTTSSSSSSSSLKQSAVIVEDTNAIGTQNSIISSNSSSSSSETQFAGVTPGSPTHTIYSTSSSSSPSKQSFVIVEEKKANNTPNSIISSTTSSSSQSCVDPRNPPVRSVLEDDDQDATLSSSSEDESDNEQPRPPPAPKKTDEQLRSDVAQSVCAYLGRTHAEYSKALAADSATEEDEDDNASDDSDPDIEDVPYDDKAYTVHHRRGRRAERRAERDVKGTALLHWSAVRKAKRAERISGYNRLCAIMKWAEREGKVPLSPSSIRASTRLRRGIFTPLGLPELPPPGDLEPRDVSPAQYGEESLDNVEQLRPRLDLTLLAFLFNEDALRLYGGLVGEQPRPSELARMDKILRELVSDFFCYYQGDTFARMMSCILC